ncbi:hypothetical protein, partial [Bacteroides faecis]|uniref:hypothetical protein n=1 Tax=Bacteroides faecis TaxID=674529 RepID=UPI0034A53030
IDKKEERLFYIKKRRGCALVLTQPLSCPKERVSPIFLSFHPRHIFPTILLSLPSDHPTSANQLDQSYKFGCYHLPTDLN